MQCRRNLKSSLQNDRGKFRKQGDFSIEIGDIFTSKTQRLGKKDVTRICGADVTQICGRSKCEYNLHPKSKLMDVVDDKFSMVILQLIKH